MTVPNSSTINLTINGQKREVPAALSVSALLAHLAIPARLTVVEVAGEIIDGELRDRTILLDGQSLEIVRLVGGG